jgi:riboflavin synthase
MFTGIIQDIGTVAAIEKKGDWLVTIDTAAMLMETTAIGASIACNGICLTVIEKKAHQFKVQLSAETISHTTALHWQVGTRVNLEHALRLGDELGGHLLTGHIDGIAYVTDKRPEGDSLRFTLEAPHELVRFLAPKGSVAIDGIALTINEVQGPHFGVNIIPHTQKMTTIAERSIGDALNFEADLIARYVERMVRGNP